jgi:hypothetical protein
MTAHHDLDRQLSDFLRDGPTELPYESFDAVRDRTEQTGQWVVIGPWRIPDMNKNVTIGLGAAVVVVAIFIGAQLFGSPSGGFGSQPTPSPDPTATPAQSVAEPSSSVAAGLPEGPHLLSEATDGGVPITVTIAAPAWEGDPGIGFLQWNEGADPPDGAGMIAFQSREYYVYGDPCHWPTTRPDTPATTVDELVDALANQASREASAPEDITVDGNTGKKIILDMADDVDIDACDEPEYPLFGVPGDDLARYSQGSGQIEELWIVDVDGLIVVLDGLYYTDTPQNAVDEVRAILASATFDGP